MTQRLQLTITYKTGTELKQLVHYLAYEDGKIIYTMDKQVHDAVQLPVRIPVENIDHYELETVMCDGWKVI